MKRVKSLDLRPGAVRRAEKEADEGFYRRAAWRRLRASFLAANPLCVKCQESDLVTPSTHAHHVVERVVDRSRELDPTNLQALCLGCHSKLHGGPPRGR